MFCRFVIKMYPALDFIAIIGDKMQHMFGRKLLCRYLKLFITVSKLALEKISLLSRYLLKIFHIWKF